MYKNIILILFFLKLIILYGNSSAQTVFINEVMSSNHSTIYDHTGSHEDWIEIYNSDTTDFSLAGHYITDDFSKPTKFQFDSTSTDLVVPSEGYLLLWASGDTSRGENHLPFKLSISGDAVGLYQNNTEAIIDTLSFGYIPTDVSFGRYQDTLRRYFQTPTPEAPNTSQAYTGILDSPVFSHPAGFYSGSFQLDISHPNPDVTIKYTLDGSNPDNNGIIYSNPISIYDRSNDPNNISLIPTNNWPSTNSQGWNPPNGLISKGNIVKAKAYHPDKIDATAKKTFFVFPDSSKKYSLPVISIITDSLNLFDSDSGIYIPGSNAILNVFETNNFANRGIEWERKAHFEYFDTSGVIKLSQDVGIRIHGAYSRSFPQKSLRIYARNLYGNNQLDYPFFDEIPDDSFRRIILRNSGNDWNWTMFRDAVAQSLVSHFNMDVQATQPAVTFINGEYWGIHNIRERYDKHYLNRVYGVDPENIDLLEKIGIVKEGDSVFFNEMIDYLDNNDLSDDSLYSMVETMMDIDNYLDYNSAQVYFGNTDWPHNNIDYWRLSVPYDSTAPKGHDGRFRWLLYDVDRSLGFTQASTNMIEVITNTDSDKLDATLIMRNLLQNQQFQYDFINRMADHLNTVFLEDYVLNRIEDFEDIFDPEMHEHSQRWRRPSSYSQWLFRVSVAKTSASQRPGHLRNHIRNFFNISQLHNLTIDVSDTTKGKVQINSILIDGKTPGVDALPYPWTGKYFNGIPVQLEAFPDSGYVFSHWEIDTLNLYSTSIKYVLNNQQTIIAHFQPDSSLYYCENQTSYVLTCPYLFDYWSENADAGSFPSAMNFVYMDEQDPGIDAAIEDVTSGVYNLENRTRVIGLNQQGVGFINTGNETGNPGYPGTRLGGAILRINTTEINNAHIQWTGGTLLAQSRKYNIRLQYRIGSQGAFIDFTDENGHIVEYEGSLNDGHDSILGPYDLPQHLINQECVEFFWRYYYTGERLSQSSGARDLLRIDDIIVTPGEAPEHPINPDNLIQAFDIGGPPEVNLHDTVTLFTLFNPDFYYDWTISKGTIVDEPDNHSIIVTWQEEGTGEVGLTVSDSFNCVYTSYFPVLIQPEELDDTTSVYEIQQENLFINVFPNPSEGTFSIKIESPQQKDYKIRLYNVYGQLQEIYYLPSNQLKNIQTHLAAGIYFLAFKNIDKQVVESYKKIIIH